jgi:hypothetical protein
LKRRGWRRWRGSLERRENEKTEGRCSSTNGGRTGRPAAPSVGTRKRGRVRAGKEEDRRFLRLRFRWRRLRRHPLRQTNRLSSGDSTRRFLLPPPRTRRHRVEPLLRPPDNPLSTSTSRLVDGRPSKSLSRLSHLLLLNLSTRTRMACGSSSRTERRQFRGKRQGRQSPPASFGRSSWTTTRRERGAVDV